MLPGRSEFPISCAYNLTGPLPAEWAWKPIASVVEAARIRGLSTGLVATSRIAHATPAGYSSHWHDRNNDNVIIEQQVYENMQVVFGGGGRHLIPTSISGGKRTDGENLLSWLTSRGYSYVTTKDQLASIIPSAATKVWGMFNPSHMQADINRKYFAPTEPSLAEMTSKAIDILSTNSVGFFLMVEGSQVDWASHNNDAVGTVTEYMAFDSAVSVALQFAKRNASTEVIVFADHDNGGMSVSRLGDSYTDLSADDLTAQLKKAKITAFGLLDMMIRFKAAGNTVDSLVVAQFLNDFMGVTDLASGDSYDVNATIASVNAGSMNDPDVANIGRIIDRRSHIGWTTYGHVGNDLPIYSYKVSNPNSIDNTEIAWHCAGKLMQVDLWKVNTRLYQEVNSLFADVSGAVVTVDTVDCDKSKGSITVSNGISTAVFPFFKNFMICGTDTTLLEGLATYSSPGKKAYLPAQAKKAFLSLNP
jgi:alkaline phosphatase